MNQNAGGHRQHRDSGGDPFAGICLMLSHSESETFKIIKTRLTLLELAVILCATFAATAVLGQALTWVGLDLGRNPPDSSNLGVSTNWNPVTTVITGRFLRFDGTVSGPLTVYSIDGINHNPFNVIGNDFASSGVSIQLASGQTSPVTLTTTVATATVMGFNGIVVDSGAGRLTLGDNTANQLTCTLRPSGGTHVWMNNSANPVIINPNLQISYAGGTAHTIDFQGTGDWTVNNNLRNNNNALAGTILWESTGTMTWSAGGVNDHFNGTLGPVIINAGTITIKSAGLLPNSPGVNVITNNGTLILDAPGQSDTISRAISGTGPLQVNSGTWTFTGSNTYAGGTTINGGTLVVGAGGTSGSVGSGPVTNDSFLVFDRSDAVTFTDAASGSGSIVQIGSGTLTLVGGNTYTGPTTVSNGMLVASSVGGDMNVSGGTLVPGSVGTIGTLNVAGSMNISTGTLLVTLNKALSPSNSIVSITGIITNSGGTLKLANFGSDLVVGDKFNVFNKPVAGGAAVPIVSPGFTVANNLAVDGSVTVASVAPSGTGQISATFSGGQLDLVWPAAWTGLHLQSQTNSLARGLGTNWFTIPGTDTGNSYSTTPNRSNGSLFYRLAP